MAWWWVAACALALYGLIAAVLDVAERMFSAVAPDGDPPRVSVVVAARNREDSIEVFLRTLTRAAASECCVPCEIVAVDDCSSDGTRLVIEKLAEANTAIKTVSAQDLPRSARADALGLSAATGPVVVVCRLDGSTDDAAVAAFVRRMLRKRDPDRSPLVHPR